MYRKEITARSPLRLLDNSIHGGLGKGNLGVVMARAGEGKTACLVQMSLDYLLRGQQVLHITLEQTVAHAQSWYDSLFTDLADRTNIEERDAVHAELTANRMICSFADHDITPLQIEEKAELLRRHLNFKPTAILIDGLDWDTRSVVRTAAMLGSLCSFAKRADAELWIAAQTHRRTTGAHPMKVPPPCAPFEELIDVAIYLEPAGDQVELRLLKNHDDENLPETHVRLDPETLRLISDGDRPTSIAVPGNVFTLLSGGATGAEATFGEYAEEWGLKELNFSFEGREPARAKSLVKLDIVDLNQGAISQIYLESRMHRTYPQTEMFQKTLQTIWHQVKTAGEVFAVGLIQPDNTVKGGTGWAPQLARRWNKPVHVFDQAKEAWFKWDGEAWKQEDAPKIHCRRFCGTGTRYLSDAGRAAIRGLYERSFGSK